MNNISMEIHLLNNLANLAGLTNIQNRLILIQNDFNQIDKILSRIRTENSQLSIEFLDKILNEVRKYIYFNLYFEILFLI
jgi:hypothetical protein